VEATELADASESREQHQPRGWTVEREIQRDGAAERLAEVEDARWPRSSTTTATRFRAAPGKAGGRSRYGSACSTAQPTESAQRGFYVVYLAPDGA
jgi:hypothetical protein